jgi:hypothetical protein
MPIRRILINIFAMINLSSTNQWTPQGTLTEREGLVRLASSLGSLFCKKENNAGQYQNNLI